MAKLGPIQVTVEPIVKLDDKDMARRITCNCDPEFDHGNADAVLLSILEHHGYHKTVETFRALPKWYS